MGHGRRNLILAGAMIALALGAWMRVAGDEGSEPGESTTDTVGAMPFAHRGGLASEPAWGQPLFEVDVAAAPQAAATGESIPVSVSREAALAAGRTGTLTVPLPGGLWYPVRYERSESAPDGNWTFIGRVDTSLGELAAVITYGPDSVFGLLPTPDGSMMKLTTRAGQAFLQPAGRLLPPGVASPRQSDALMAPPLPGGRLAAESAPAMRAGSAEARTKRARFMPSPRTQLQVADDELGEVTITVLGVFTANLVELRGSPQAPVTEFFNMLAVANQAHIDSGSRVRLALSGFVEVDFPAASLNGDALYSLRVNTLPDGTDVHAMRDAAAADLVALIRPYAETDPTCGIAYYPGGELQARELRAASGFSVTAVEACSPLVLAHEIGHNLGLAHDRETATQRNGSLRYGAFPFSFGYRQDGPPAFATVMAYDVGNQVWINRFSHPGTELCAGTSCGVTDKSDSVRSLNLTADSISRFRDPPGTISAMDAWVLEPGASGSTLGYFEIRLSSPAPAGGVSFTTVVEGGTAELGVDAILDMGDQAEWTIEEGGTRTKVSVLVHSDDIVEPPETIVLRIQDVQGPVSVFDATAVMTIVDFSPTINVEGHLDIPAGSVLPGQETVWVEQVVEGVSETWVFEVSPPDFRFNLGVANGATLIHTTSDLPAPLISPRIIVEAIDEETPDIGLEIKQGVLLSGVLRESGKDGTYGTPVLLWNYRGDGWGKTINYPFCCISLPQYSVYVLPGVPMQLEVVSPWEPFAPQVVEIPPLYGPSTWNIELNEKPSLTIAHESVVEGTAEDGSRMVRMAATLTTPAPAGGIGFRINASGTADEDDFQVPAGPYYIHEGTTMAIVPVTIHGDDFGERDEVVELHVVDIQGDAWSPGPGSVRIITDERRPDAGSCIEPVSESSFRMCH